MPTLFLNFIFVLVCTVFLQRFSQIFDILNIRDFIVVDFSTIEIEFQPNFNIYNQTTFIFWGII